MKTLQSVIILTIPSWCIACNTSPNIEAEPHPEIQAQQVGASNNPKRTKTAETDADQHRTFYFPISPSEPDSTEEVIAGPFVLQSFLIGSLFINTSGGCGSIDQYINDYETWRLHNYQPQIYSVPLNVPEGSRVCLLRLPGAISAEVISGYVPYP